MYRIVWIERDREIEKDMQIESEIVVQEMEMIEHANSTIKHG